MKFIKYDLYVVSLQGESEVTSVPGCFPTKYVSQSCDEKRSCDGMSRFRGGNERFQATWSENVGVRYGRVIL